MSTDQAMKVEIKGSVWDLGAMALAVVSLALVIVNAALVMRNQGIQADVTQRQQIINQGLQLARIRQGLAQVIGNLAVSKQDHDLSDLLARHGISVSGTPSAAPIPAPTTPQGK
jgi:hypothetical protein